MMAQSETGLTAGETQGIWLPYQIQEGTYMDVHGSSEPIQQVIVSQHVTQQQLNGHLVYLTVQMQHQTLQ